MSRFHTINEGVRCYRYMRRIRLKRGILLGLAAALICLLAPAVLAAPVLPERPANLYVGDFAQVLEPSTVNAIVRENESLFDETGAEILVVTVDFLDGWDIADYAMELGNQWGIGSAERQNGVVLLLAIGEDNYWVTVSKGLEDYISDGVLGDILEDYLEPDFARGDYDAGVQRVFGALLNTVRKVYASGDTMIPPRAPAEEYAQASRRVFAIPDFVKALFLFIFIVAVVSVTSGGRRRRRPYIPPPPPIFYGPGRRYRPPPPPFFGGPPRSGPRHSGGFSFGGSHRSRGGGFTHRSGGSSFRGGGTGRR